jgi:hypothetical protein
VAGVPAALSLGAPLWKAEGDAPEEAAEEGEAAEVALCAELAVEVKQTSPSTQRRRCCPLMRS